MKTKLKIKNIEIAGVKIGEVAVEQDYSVTEILKLANGGKNFVKELLKDLKIYLIAQKVLLVMH